MWGMCVFLNRTASAEVWVASPLQHALAGLCVRSLQEAERERLGQEHVCALQEMEEWCNAEMDAVKDVTQRQVSTVERHAHEWYVPQAFQTDEAWCSVAMHVA